MSTGKRRKKRHVPTMLFWSRSEQRRFIDAVERFVACVGDLETMIAAKKRKVRPKPDHVVDGNGVAS